MNSPGLGTSSLLMRAKPALIRKVLWFYFVSISYPNSFVPLPNISVQWKFDLKSWRCRSQASGCLWVEKISWRRNSLLVKIVETQCGTHCKSTLWARRVQIWWMIYETWIQLILGVSQWRRCFTSMSHFVDVFFCVNEAEVQASPQIYYTFHPSAKGIQAPTNAS